MKTTEEKLKEIFGQAVDAAEQNAACMADLNNQFSILRLIDLTESPIEKLLIAAYAGFLYAESIHGWRGSWGYYLGVQLWAERDQTIDFVKTLCADPKNVRLPAPSGCPWMYDVVVPQVIVGDYRADAIACRTVFDTFSERQVAVWCAIECDGHDFHERTKEQAARDRSRDRHFQTIGLPVLRFTGSEIWKDPWKCGLEIDKFLNDALRREVR